LVRNVTVFDGEGGRIDHGAVLFADGKVVQVGQDIAAPDGATVIDGSGKWLTPGIIDVHSHIGGSTLNVAAENDINEMTSPVTPGVWVEHSLWPNDPGFIRDLTNGGVTTLQVLPGSGNLFGGRSVVLKNVYARTIQGMKFPGAPYGLKMACGENPKRVYGSKGQLPSTRMGNIELDRETWAKAVEYKRKWDHYEEKGGDPPARDLGWPRALSRVLPISVLPRSWARVRATTRERPNLPFPPAWTFHLRSIRAQPSWVWSARAESRGPSYRRPPPTRFSAAKAPSLVWDPNPSPGHLGQRSSRTLLRTGGSFHRRCTSIHAFQGDRAA
jgi:hypothetical protein